MCLPFFILVHSPKEYQVWCFGNDRLGDQKIFLRGNEVQGHEVTFEI